MAKKEGVILGGPKGINLGVYGGFNLLHTWYFLEFLWHNSSLIGFGAMAACPGLWLRHCLQHRHTVHCHPSSHSFMVWRICSKANYPTL